MKDSIALLAVRIAADMPDLAGPIIAIIQGTARLPEAERESHMTRMRTVLKGLDSRRITAPDAFAALKVQVDDIVDSI